MYIVISKAHSGGGDVYSIAHSGGGDVYRGGGVYIRWWCNNNAGYTYTQFSSIAVDIRNYN